MARNEECVSTIEAAVGYQFLEPAILLTALTHSSYAAENSVESYERLEFLGDAVLELAVTEKIYEALPGATEGRMTRVRAAIVDESTLAKVARSIGLAEVIRLGVGEDRAGGRDRSSILSDVLEGVLGAVYVDGGPEAASRSVILLLGDEIADRIATSHVVDDRSALQEQLARSGKLVSFAYERFGPDHAVTYTATAYVEGEVIGRGAGGSKKGAAIAAAKDALETES